MFSINPSWVSLATQDFTAITDHIISWCPCNSLIHLHNDTFEKELMCPDYIIIYPYILSIYFIQCHKDGYRSMCMGDESSWYTSSKCRLLIVSDSCVLLLMREIIERITAGSLMVRTPIILVRRPISLGLIKDLSNHAITVQRPLKCRESNHKLEQATQGQDWGVVAGGSCSSVAEHLAR